MTDAEHLELARAVLPAVIAAGAAELRHFESGVRVETKDDNTPVTAADREAEDIITAALSQSHAHYPVIGEEAASLGRLPQVDHSFFLVDALDGTRDFVAGRTEFTVNVAFIENHRPVFGAVYQPVPGRLFVTVGAERALETRIAANSPAPAFNDGDAWQPVRTRPAEPDHLTVAVSRSHHVRDLDERIRRNGIKQRLQAGSSLKFCLLARGEADVYPRLTPISQWDTAAGHAILQAAGGAVLTLDNAEIVYGPTEDDFAMAPFVAWGDRRLAERISFL